MRSRLTRFFTRVTASLCLLLAAACDPGAPEGTWRKIERPGFSFELPGKPEIKEESMDVGGVAIPQQSMDLYRGQEQFSVNVMDFSPLPNALNVDAKGILDRMIEGGLKQSGGTASSDRSLSMPTGQSAREIVANITNPAPAQMIVRVIWDSPRAYLIAHTNRSGAADTPDGRKFIDSFQFTAK